MAHRRNSLVQYRRLHPMVRVVFVVALLSAACESDRSGAGDSGGDVGKGGRDSLGGSLGTPSGNGGGNPFVPRLECGGFVCGPDASCCTVDDTCGSKYGEQVFIAACVELRARGGAKSTDCPASPRYCKGERCQEFPGCLDASSKCGFWVEGFDLVAGDEVMHVTAELECVGSEEFREP